MLNRAILRPPSKVLISGLFPRLPMSCTLFFNAYMCFVLCIDTLRGANTVKVYVFQSIRAHIDGVKMGITKGGIRKRNVYLELNRLITGYGNVSKTDVCLLRGSSTGEKRQSVL